MLICRRKRLRNWQPKASSYDIRVAVQSPCVKASNNMVRGREHGVLGGLPPSHRRSDPSVSSVHPSGCADDQERVSMIIDRKVSSIESSFQMDSMLFDEECRRRVKDVLSKNTSAVDAVAELNRKYSVLAQKNGGSIA